MPDEIPLTPPDGGGEPPPAAPEASASASEPSPTPDTSAGPEVALTPEPEPEAPPTEEGILAETPEAALAAPAIEKPLTPQQQAEDKLLGEAYRDHPALKTVLKEHPELRPQFFKAVQFEKMGLRTIRDAETAIDYSRQLINFDRLYFSENPEDALTLVETLWENQIDPDTGKSTGHFDRVAEVIVQRALENVSRAASTDPQFAGRAGITGDQAKIAVQHIARMLGLKLGGDNGISTGIGQQPTDIERRLADREAKLAARERQISEGAHKSFVEDIDKSFQGWIEGEVNSALKPIEAVLAKQPKLFQGSVRQEIVNRVFDAVKNDDLFVSQVESSLRRGNRGPEHAAAIQRLLETRAQHFLPSITAAVMGEAGLQIKAQADAREARQAAAAARREPVGSSNAGRLSGRPALKVPDKGQGYDKFADALLNS